MTINKLGRLRVLIDTWKALGVFSGAQLSARDLLQSTVRELGTDLMGDWVPYDLNQSRDELSDVRTGLLVAIDTALREIEVEPQQSQRKSLLIRIGTPTPLEIGTVDITFHADGSPNSVFLSGIEYKVTEFKWL